MPALGRRCGVVGVQSLKISDPPWKRGRRKNKHPFAAVAGIKQTSCCLCPPLGPVPQPPVRGLCVRRLIPAARQAETARVQAGGCCCCWCFFAGPCQVVHLFGQGLELDVVMLVAFSPLSQPPSNHSLAQGDTINHLLLDLHVRTAPHARSARDDAAERRCCCYC